MRATVLYSDLLPLFFNVSAHVGPGRTNKPDDVLLVRFLLKKCGEYKPKFAALKDLPVKSNFDAQTAQAIVLFQTEEKKRRPGIVADGVISPVRGESPSYGGAVWTICQLNKYVKDKNTHLWPRLHDMPDCPSALKEQCLQQVVGREAV